MSTISRRIKNDCTEFGLDEKKFREEVERQRYPRQPPLSPRGLRGCCASGARSPDVAIARARCLRVLLHHPHQGSPLPLPDTHKGKDQTSDPADASLTRPFWKLRRFVAELSPPSSSREGRERKGGEREREDRGEEDVGNR